VTLVPEVGYSCFQSPKDHSGRLFPTFHLLLAVGLVDREPVRLSLRIEWVEGVVELLDLVVANLGVVVVSRCSMREGLEICGNHLRCRHRLLRILAGVEDCCICWLWR
jgi:hypothetical protein